MAPEQRPMTAFPKLSFLYTMPDTRHGDGPTVLQKVLS